MERVAGTYGVFGLSGYGGPADLTELNFPESLAVDTNGNC